MNFQQDKLTTTFLRWDMKWGSLCPGRKPPGDEAQGGVFVFKLLRKKRGARC